MNVLELVFIAMAAYTETIYSNTFTYVHVTIITLQLAANVAIWDIIY